MSNGAAAAAAHQQLVFNAVRSWGPVVKIEADGFRSVLQRSLENEQNPLVVTATGGWFSTAYMYLMVYKGLYFYTSSPYPLPLPSQAEVVQVKKIWMPN